MGTAPGRPRDPEAEITPAIVSPAPWGGTGSGLGKGLFIFFKFFLIVCDFGTKLLTGLLWAL